MHWPAFGLSLLLALVAVRAQQEEPLDVLAQSAGDGVNVRVLSDTPVAHRLNESDYSFSVLHDWQLSSAEGQPSAYVCTLSVILPLSGGLGYVARLVSENDAVFLRESSLVVCLSNSSHCNITLDVVTRQLSVAMRSVRVVVVLDALVEGDNATSVAFVLPLPADPCMAPDLVPEAQLFNSGDNPYQITVAAPSNDTNIGITARMQNAGQGASSFLASLVCDPLSPIAYAIHPSDPLQCTLPAGEGCPLSWQVAILDRQSERTLLCQVRLGVARLPCWSREAKYAEQMLTIVLPDLPTGAIQDSAVAAMAACVALVALALIGLGVAWFVSEWMKRRVTVEEKTAREYRADLLERHLARPPETSPFLPIHETAVDDL